MPKDPAGVSDAVCGVVLAGGQSRRMGANKALMPFKGKTLIAYATDVLSSLFSEVVIVTDARSHSENDYACFSCPVLCDRTAGIGPIGGIETALRAFPGKGIFVAAADMPFLKAPVIKAMLAHTAGCDWVVPELAGRLHPLHAFYGPDCLPAITAAIRSKSFALHRLVLRLRTCFFPEKTFRSLDPDLRSLFNINTPETFAQAETLPESI